MILTVEANLHPLQREVARSPARRKVVVCGRRWGKTTLGTVLAAQESLERGGRTWWLAPTYRQSQEGWRRLVRIARQIPRAQIRETDYTITWPNGALTEVRTTADPQRLRGAGLAGIVIDEAALVDELTWTEVLQPSLLDHDGWALFISTPHGNNWFRRLYDEAQTLPGWQAWRFPSATNPHLSEEAIEALRLTMSPEEFEQEIQASFLVAADLVYSMFDRRTHMQYLRADASWQGGAIGADYGDVHPSTVVAVTRESGGRLWVRACWYGDGDTGRWVAEMGEQCSRYGISRNRIRIDPTQRSIARGYSFNAASLGDGSRRSRIGLVKRLFNSGGLVFDLAGPGMQRLASEIENYRWDRNPDGTLKDSPLRVNEDGVAALEYAIEELEGERRQEYGAWRGVGTGLSSPRGLQGARLR